METIVENDIWYVKPLELPDAENYISDIYNITFAATGSVSAWKSNLFLMKRVNSLLMQSSYSNLVIMIVLFIL